MDHWMQTYSGGQFFYDPGAHKDVSVIDIAISLARLPRFSGHTTQFLSVAEHSCAVAETLAAEGADPRLQLLGLLHDAHEAYLGGDWPKPLCDYLSQNYAIDINAFKRATQNQILLRLGLDKPTPAEEEKIKAADLITLAAERDLVMRSSHPWHVDHLTVPDYVRGQYGFWGSDEARHHFEQVYATLSSTVTFNDRISSTRP